MRERIQLLAAGVAVFATSAAFANDPKPYRVTGQFSLPDLGSISIPIDVPDSGIIKDIDIGFIMSHTWQGDLIFELEHAGTRVPILYRPGDSFGNGLGFSADNFGSGGTEFLLDDEAANFYDSAPPNGWGNVPDPGIANVSGAWAPYGSGASGLTRTLGSFDGHDKNGRWLLHISDNAGGDVGTLTQVTLYISNIPGPGALALLGVAGVVARRRRRA